MKIISYIGGLICSALLVVAASSAASAAVYPAHDPTVLAAPQSPAENCMASMDLDQAIFFVEAKSGCDAALAEVTGLCLEEAKLPLTSPLVAVFSPLHDVSCTGAAIRPSPPG